MVDTDVLYCTRTYNINLNYVTQLEKDLREEFQNVNQWFRSITNLWYVHKRKLYCTIGVIPCEHVDVNLL